MFFTKDRNSINESSGIKISFRSSEISNNSSSSSLSDVNSFRSSDRSSYTSTEIDTFRSKNYTDNYALKSSKSNKNDTQAIAAIQPDLIARTVSPPSSAAAGSTIQLSYEIENQGNASAGYSYTKFYLSQDLSLGSEDIFLGDDYVDNILSGYYRSESTTLTIGNSVAAGSYYLVYQADGYNYVAESNENNNAVADVINITKPDLIVQNTSNPSSAAAGSSIQLNYQIKNQGNASAVVKNNFGVTGIAYNAKIMALKTGGSSPSDESINSQAVVKAIRYAVDNGANVINLSLGSSSPNSDEQSAIQYAASKGVFVVSAAGNDGGTAPIYPARYADQWGLAVGAAYYNKTLADFSNRAGTTPLTYVTAPGAYFEGDLDLVGEDGHQLIGIYSTLPGNKYGFEDGTSMAAPHVAGVIALMLSAKKGLSNAQVRQIVTTTAANSLA
ncbi:S8 family serine peptidase [Nostoc sp. 'Peltigera membranacea cyanobiont' N6]|uniref:S8 family serine peptidase n=1 Tax=Nostoc sp. 'Peltigera membranacea cyanobiont' N6 TaxID=1261031 RepID=UPI000CF352D5|nr:S8 family serine peptidase [Nostoc sp. 'Peltigera membranacea cyanobiont' N6]AVH67597.1 subtilisin family serine protease [Nostoc sp. 'Peltigera membranacea cyanobiont' N6]